MSIKMKLEGFEDILKDIEKAGRSMESAVESCMKQSANTMNKSLKTEMQKSNVKQHLIDEMPEPKVFKDGNAVVAQVGYVKDSYNLKNPSNAYKVIFLNYGTPHRSKHGIVEARGFIQRAKKSANKTIKKQQKETLMKILERLGKK